MFFKKCVLILFAIGGEKGCEITFQQRGSHGRVAKFTSPKLCKEFVFFVTRILSLENWPSIKKTVNISKVFTNGTNEAETVYYFTLLSVEITRKLVQLRKCVSPSLIMSVKQISGPVNALYEIDGLIRVNFN